MAGFLFAYAPPGNASDGTNSEADHDARLRPLHGGPATRVERGPCVAAPRAALVSRTGRAGTAGGARLAGSHADDARERRRAPGTQSPRALGKRRSARRRRMVRAARADLVALAFDQRRAAVDRSSA